MLAPERALREVFGKAYIALLLEATASANALNPYLSFAFFQSIDNERNFHEKFFSQ